MVILALIIGACVGGFVARRRGGTKFDIAQYAAVYGIGFAVIAVFGSVILARLG